MIAKTSIGSSFVGAINYGAGFRVDGREIKGKSELLLLQNVISHDPKGIAAEMHQEASYSRCKKPVWHTSRYCSKMGAEPRDHQIVVYQHHDQPHRHIHIYINRVPVNGGPALVTSHNYARNVRVCQEISQELGFAKLERLEEGQLRHMTQDQLDAQSVVHLAIKEALKAKTTSPEDMERLFKKKNINCRFKLEEGKLKYSSYCYQGVPIKGQDVGFTARQLQARLDKNLLEKEAKKVKPQESIGKRRIRW